MNMRRDFLAALTLAGLGVVAPAQSALITDLNEDLFNGWNGRGVSSAGKATSSGIGSLRAGWFDGNFAGAVPSTMLGWAWPDSGTGTDPLLEAAVGYSWNGTHDSGWAAAVGYESLNPAAVTWDNATVRPFAGKTYTGQRVRSNAGLFGAGGTLGGSSSSIVYTAGSSDPLEFDMSAFSWASNPGNVNPSGQFYFGIYSVADAAWLPGSSTFVGLPDYHTGSGNIVATDNVVAPGDQYFISYSNISGSNNGMIGGTISSVPEPITGGLLALSGLLLVRRRGSRAE